MDIFIELSEEVLGLDKEVVRQRMDDFLKHNQPPAGFYKTLSAAEISRFRALAQKDPEGFRRFAFSGALEFMTGKTMH
jgi:hypothetical protein